jgi:hypothetical protein
VECARFGLCKETANLHHGVACRVEPDLGLAREFLGRDVGIDNGSVDGIDARRLLFGRRPERHLSGYLSGYLSGDRAIFRLRSNDCRESAQPHGDDKAGELQ